MVGLYHFKKAKDNSTKVNYLLTILYSFSTKLNLYWDGRFTYSNLYFNNNHNSLLLCSECLNFLNNLTYIIYVYCMRMHFLSYSKGSDL